MDTGTAPRLSLTDWAVLALLDEGPAHPFGLARRLAPDGDLGHILTVRRPLVYRALERLVKLKMAAPERTEPGDSGPRRTVHRITAAGRDQVARWRETPVDRVRDLRIEFLLKATLLRRGSFSTDALINRQRAALADRLRRLESLPAEPGIADLWRHHTARAVQAFLDDPFWKN